MTEERQLQCSNSYYTGAMENFNMTSKWAQHIVATIYHAPGYDKFGEVVTKQTRTFKNRWKDQRSIDSMTTESYLQRLSHTKQLNAVVGLSHPKQLTAVVGLGLQVTGHKRAQEEVPTKSSSFWHKQRTEH
jgi:hypothetical protein